jgi:hypothetical protein
MTNLHRPFGRALIGSIVAIATIACTAAPGVSPGSADPTSSSSNAQTASAPASSISPSPTGDPSSTPIPSSEVPASILEQILADASQRTGVPIDALVIREARLVTWPDGGLGCPEPGMVYIQVLVDGYQVVVVADMAVLDYRGGGRDFRLCPLSSG